MLIENKGVIAELSDLIFENYMARVNQIMADFGTKDFIFLQTQDWNDIRSQLITIANQNGQ